jgi:hypothetical protein
VEQERPQTICHIRVSCWVSKATRAQAHSRAHAPTPTCTHTHALIHAHKHQTEIRNTYFFSTKTVVSWTRLNVTLYVHFLSCYRILIVWFYKLLNVKHPTSALAPTCTSLSASPPPSVDHHTQRNSVTFQKTWSCQNIKSYKLIYFKDISLFSFCENETKPITDVKAPQQNNTPHCTPLLFLPWPTLSQHSDYSTYRTDCTPLLCLPLPTVCSLSRWLQYA